MATMYRYQLPVEQTGWKLNGETETSFSWEYEDEREKLLALYDKGKKQQWDAATRIDWSLDLDPENPQEIDDRLIPIFGSPLWEKMDNKERIRVRQHQQAQTLSQFMHGEQVGTDGGGPHRADRARPGRKVLRGHAGDG